MRSMWKGSLSFGLVNIPVEMYVASRERELKFVLLHDADHSPIRYARICKEEGKEVPWSHVVRGYESEKGKFVVMSDEDFKKATQARTSSIEIEQFVNLEEVDSLYFEKPYYLEPQRGASKPYALLVEALKKSQKAAVAKYVIHNREHLCLIKASGSLLILNQLRFDNEILESKELKIPKGKVAQKELDMALELIRQMTKKFNVAQFKDTYVDILKKIIKRKDRGQKITIAKSANIDKVKVYDIMSALKASLKDKKRAAR
jgi:DNA end-binding protein Ku